MIIKREWDAAQVRDNGNVFTVLVGNHDGKRSQGAPYRRREINIRIYILVYNSNKLHKSQSLFNLKTALHVSGVTITHLQEHKTTVTTASGNRYTVLLSAAIVEELEPV